MKKAKAPMISLPRVDSMPAAKTKNKARWFLILTIIICSAAIGVAYYMSYLYEPHNYAERTFHEIAAEYYENYMYPNFVNAYSKGRDETWKSGDAQDLPESVVEAFEQYTETGFGEIRLRHIINQLGVKTNAFDNEEITCDKNVSSVVFVPRAPFGAKDYEARYTLICSNNK